MLGNFFNNMYYGKAGKGDFRPEDLPTNRMQLFFEMLRVRWSGIIRVNLLYLLAWIPAIVWSLINLALLFTLADGYADPTAVEGFAELAGGLSLSDQLVSVMFTYLFGMIPCIAITGPFTAGVTYIMRNWARDQHVFIMSDFKDAIKANWKQALGVSCITAVMPALIAFLWNFYSVQAQGSVLFIIPQMITLLVGVVWMLSLNIIYSLMITYELPLKQLITNSLILSLGRLPQALGIRLLSLVVPAIVLVMVLFTNFAVYAMLVAALYYLVLGFGFNRFVYASYANALCDKYINPRIEGAPMNMGLRQETDEDYEIDPTMPQPPSVTRPGTVEEQE